MSALTLMTHVCIAENETRHSSLAFQFLPKFFGSCPSITGSTSSLAARLSEVMDRQPLKEALFRGSHRKCIRVTTNNQRFLHRPLLLGLFVARNRVERMEPHPSRNAAKKRLLLSKCLQSPSQQFTPLLLVILT